MSRVWDETPSDLGHSDLLILLVIADHANDDGLCWPSAARIARRSKLSERQVRRRLALLEGRGFIAVDKRDGKTSLVRLLTPNPGHPDVTPDTMTPLTFEGGHPGHPDVRPTPDTQMSDEPSVNLHKEPLEQKPRTTTLPEGWVPNETHVERARSRGIDVEHQATQFRLHAQATGRRMANWNAAFSMWLNNAKPSPGRPPARTDTDRVLGVLDIDMSDTTLEQELEKRINGQSN